MQRLRVLKVTLLALGVCLCTAWFGASNAAAQQPVATGRMSAAADEGLALIKSDTESIILELRTPSYQMEEISVDGVAYHLLTVAGYGQTGDVGHPQLPLKGTLLGIPPAADFTLTVLEVEEEIVSERYNIYPVPQPVFEHDLEGDLTYAGLEFAKDESVYSSDRFYPASIAEVGSSGFIRDQRVVDLRFFPFQYDPVSGELRHCRRIRVELSFGYPGGHPVLAATWGEDDPFHQVLEDSLLNYDSALSWRARSSTTLSGPTVSEQEGSSYKVMLDQDGIYQLTYADISDAGIDVDNVDPRTFKLHNQGDEAAIYVVGEDDGEFDTEDYILFYGQRMTSMYTDTNVYWLTMGGFSGLRMGERDGTLGASTVLTSFQTTNRWEEDLYYQSTIAKPDTIPSEEEKDHWFGGFIATFGEPASESYAIMLHNVAVSPPPYSSTVRGYLHGFSDFDDNPDHHTKVFLNGHLLDDATWDGQVEYQFETDIPQSYLLEGSNTISVECPFTGLPITVTQDIIFANWFEIDYHRRYTVENDSLFFDGDEAGTWQYEVGDFLTDTIEVFDITDPLGVTRILSTTVVASDSYSLKFEDIIVGEHHYVALTPAQYQSPLGIVEDSPSSLKDTSNRADYLVITHPDFYDAVLPLRDHREAEGLDTVVVDVQDVYDEFSYGLFDPHAIRDFISYTLAYWRDPDEPPSYVLLVGDGNYDFKDNLGRGEPNYIPPYLVYTDEWVGEADADNRYVCVSGDDILPDMHLGRLPAQTAGQASAMVTKIINYEQNLPEGDWRRQVLFVADNPDDAGDFRALSDDIVDNHLLPPYTAEKAYYGLSPYTTPAAVKNAIINAFGTGRLFINYVGHGSRNRWAAEEFLTVGDIDSLPSTQRMPMMLPMACLEGYFIKAGAPCVGESLVRAEGKGAIASWSPTSDGLASGHHYLHQGFYDALFVDGVHQIGPATLLGKLNLYYNAGGDHRELIDTFILFGDPAIDLTILDQHVFLPMTLKTY